MEATFETITDAATFAYRIESRITEMMQAENISGWVLNAAVAEVARLEELGDNGTAASGLLTAYEERQAAAYESLGELLALASRLKVCVPTKRV